MKYREFLELIEKQTGVKPSHTKVSKILGGKPSANALSNRYFNDGNLKYEEMIILEHAFKLDGQLVKESHQTIREMVEIPYWNELTDISEKLRNPLVTSMWFDREIITNVWKKDPKYLKIIAMPGDKMSGGDYPIRTSDILLLDTKLTDISQAGIYFFTTNNKNMFVNIVNVLFDGSVQMSFYNPSYPTKVIPIDQLEAAGFKVWGRMIKNLSLTK